MNESTLFQILDKHNRACIQKEEQKYQHIVEEIVKQKYQHVIEQIIHVMNETKKEVEVSTSYVRQHEEILHNY